MAKKEQSFEGTVRVKVIITLAPDRIVSLTAALKEYFSTEKIRWRLARSGDDLHITADYIAETLDNGTLSACTWMLTILDDTFSQVAEHRWYLRLKLTAGVLEINDDLPDNDDEEYEGDDDE